MIDDTIRGSIQAALLTWDRALTQQRVTEAEALRQQFLDRFPRDGWSELPVESYALGQQAEGGTVCWWLEFKTKPIASMSGGSAFKHLIFRATDGGWRFPKEYGSVEQAWISIRAGFVEAFELAANGMFDETDDVRVLTGAPALRAKVLYMYFPNELVPVCSRTHIEHFLSALGQDLPQASPIRANRQLLAALRDVPELSDLTTQELGYFLYHWADPRTSVRAVKIAPGERAKFWDDCLKNRYICIGWDDVGDLNQYESKDAFKDAFREHYPYNDVERQVSRKSNELWTIMELEPGDKVIANRGTSEVLAVGTVNDDGYAWRPARNEFKHTLGIDWDTSIAREIEPVKAWATTTVSKIPGTLYQKLTVGTGTPPKPVEADQVYRDIEQALRLRGQVVLYGPPGTGKTYTARRAAVWLLAGGSGSNSAAETLTDDASFTEQETLFGGNPLDQVASQLTRVTFHPSYGYEDFIEGFRPRQSSSGTLQLELTDGIFKRVCRAANADPNHRYVVLIDEINRGNIPKIFGELITLIEKDKRGYTLRLPQSGEEFSVPPNVLIVGTMNTADRSIHLLDSALRRRFRFIELLPDSDLLEGAVAGALALDVFLDNINDKIRSRVGREKQVGHAMFYNGKDIIDTPEAFAAMFRHELLPLLQEYLYEDYGDLANFLGEVIDADSEKLSAAFASDADSLCAVLANHFGANASA